MSVAAPAGFPTRLSIISSITTPASNHDLTTLAVVKGELSLTSTDAPRDTVLSRYIAECSAAAENFCNRVFVTETMKDRIFPARDAVMQIAFQGLDVLQLSRWPIVSISSLTENGEALVANDDYIVDASNGQIYRIDGAGYPRRWDAFPIVVDYVGGYSTIPADVSAAVIRMVSQRWFARGRDPNLRGETIPGVYQANYWVSTGVDGGQDGNLSPDVQAMLDNYRTPVVT